MFNRGFIVVPYRPKILLISILALITFSVLITAGSYYLGKYHAWPTQKQMTSQRNSLEKDLTQLSEKLEEAQKNIILLKQQETVHTQASQELQEQLTTSQNKIASLEKKVKLYQNIMSPESTKKNIQIQRLDITQVGDKTSRTYNYKLLVTQTQSNHTIVNGHISAKLSGKLDDKTHEVPLQFSNKDEVSDKPKLRFRYFQELSGQIKLPEGFSPKQVVIGLSAKTPKSITFERIFSWSS